MFDRISSRTPPSVAKARIEAWQKKREMQFVASISNIVLVHHREGLEKRRIAEILGALAKALES